MRVFVVHDEEGNIVTIGQFEELSDQVAQPFHVTNPKHVVVELDADDEGFKAVAADRTEGKKKGLLKVHSEFAVDTKTRGGKGLVKKAARPPIVADPTPNPGPVPPAKQPLPKAPTPAPTEPKVPPIGKAPLPGETPPTRVPTDAEEK